MLLDFGFYGGEFRVYFWFGKLFFNCYVNYGIICWLLSCWFVLYNDGISVVG